jgi:hypothetical protein
VRKLAETHLNHGFGEEREIGEVSVNRRSADPCPASNASQRQGCGILRLIDECDRCVKDFLAEEFATASGVSDSCFLSHLNI